MAPIVQSVEISRSPEDVFAYMTDVARFGEWQQSLVGARLEGGSAPAVGTHIIQTRGWVGASGR